MKAKPTTRRDTARRKQALCDDLRAVGRTAALSPGDVMVSVRELSAKYGLAIRTVSLELQKLADEGVLYTVPRVGTFVGRPQSARGDLFLALFPHLQNPNIHMSAVRAGFEERIARLGGTSLVLDYETARRFRAQGELTAMAGIFEFQYGSRDESLWLEMGVPHAEFGELSAERPGSDAVYFDNPDGGWQATRHLLALGHRRIAFLGLHGTRDEAGFFLWSLEREAGWRRALQEAGVNGKSLSFRPPHTPAVGDDQVALTCQTARRLLARDDITAVVAVNAGAAHGLFEALRKENRPVREWPAVVSFDTELMQNSDDALHVVTALRLPWEEIGREAANLLWERSQGRLSEPQQRLVPMNLIARLSCRQEWHRAPKVTEPYQNRVVAVA